MLIWMEHEKHGRMPCYSTQEVEANKKHGWKVIEDNKLKTEEIEPTFASKTITETRTKRKYTKRVKEERLNG